MAHKKVAIGGTFHLLHRGHKALLRRAFEVGEEVIIGLMTDMAAENLHKGHLFAPYSERLEELRDFLVDEGVLERARIVPLYDPHGPTITEEDIEAIVVSEETRPAAEEINWIRRGRGFKPLEVVVKDMILAEDGKTLSTTRIVRGEVDREGLLIDKEGSS